MEKYDAIELLENKQTALFVFAEELTCDPFGVRVWAEIHQCLKPLYMLEGSLRLNGNGS